MYEYLNSLFGMNMAMCSDVPSEEAREVEMEMAEDGPNRLKTKMSNGQIPSIS